MLVLSKPITYNGTLWAGAVATYETATLVNNSQDINGYIATDNSTLGHNIGWETSPTDSEWTNGSVTGYGLFTMVISQIGTNTSPTIAQLNSHPLVTDYLHSSSSNSLNGTAYDSTSTAVVWDWGNLTVSISGHDTISFSNSHNKYGSGIPTQLRSVDTTSSTWYLNGISTGASQGGGSGNENYPTDYFSKTDFRTDTVNFKDKIIEKIPTNQSDIIEYLVKSALPPSQIKQLYVQLTNEDIID